MGHYEAVSWVQDIAGGLVVTGPSEEDWLNPQTRPYIERFLGGSQGVGAEERLRALNRKQRPDGFYVWRLQRIFGHSCGGVS